MTIVFIKKTMPHVTKEKWFKASILVLVFFMLSSCTHQDWRTAERGSVGIAPDPADEPAAIVQIYAARAARWRGYFAVHSWIATKKANASTYTTWQVIGYRLRRGGSSLVVLEGDVPDRHWFGSKPLLISDIRGDKAASAIEKIETLTSVYPYEGEYKVWPGPNSNTYVSHMIRSIEELGVELPPHAIGKDWMMDAGLVGWSESGTGVQLSVLGVLGGTLGLAEGIEINILGLVFGIDFYRPALKLPFVGRLGFPDEAIFN